MWTIKVQGFGLLLCIFISLVAADETRYVATNGQDQDGCGLAPSSPCHSIQYAILESSPGNATILVARGSYTITKVTFNHRYITISSIEGPELTKLTPAMTTTPGFFIEFSANDPGGIIDGFGFTSFFISHSSNIAGGALVVKGRNAASSPLIIRNSSFTDCVVFINMDSVTMGGAAYIESANVLFENVQFTNNRAILGGAIYATTSAMVSIVNCGFIRNYVRYPGIPSDKGRGGAICFNGRTLSISHSEFHDNEAYHGGALSLGVSSIANIDASQFFDNSATTFGGAVHADSMAALSIIDTLFRENSAGSLATPQSLSEGGALYWASSETVTMRRAYFVSNTAPLSSAIAFVSGGSILTAVSITGNTARVGTVSIKSSIPISWTEVHITENTAQSTASILRFTGPSQTATFTQCNFSSNMVANGGMIFSESSTINFMNCDFYSNRASEYYPVFDVSVTSGSITFQDSTFSRNVADIGAVGHIDLSAAPTFTNCLFTDNSAEEDCGVIHIESSAIPLFRHCIFRNNRAKKNGGALLVRSLFSCEDCSFISNKALLGGAVFFDTGRTMPDPTSAQCTNLFVQTAFTQNDAEVSGAAIYWETPSPVCPGFCPANRCVFTSNTLSSKASDDADVGYGAHHFTSLTQDTALNVWPGRLFSFGVQIQDFRNLPIPEAFDPSTGQPLKITVDVSVDPSDSTMSNSTQSTLLGTTTVASMQGAAKFTDLKLLATPGSYLLTVSVFSPSQIAPVLSPLMFKLKAANCPADYWKKSSSGGFFTCVYVAETQASEETSSGRTILLILSSLSVLFAGFVGFCVAAKAKSLIIQAAQPIFCFVFLTGVIGMFATVIIGHGYPPSAKECVMQIWFGHLGLATVLTALVAKLHLVVRNNLLTIERISTDLRLPAYMLPTLASFAAYLTLWSAVSPPQPTTVALSGQTFDDLMPNRVYTVCKNDKATWPVIPAVAQAAILIYAVILAIRTSHISSSMFNERSHMALTSYALACIAIICGLTFPLNSNDEPQIFVLVLSSLFAAAFVALTFVFVPKILRLFSSSGDTFTPEMNTNGAMFATEGTKQHGRLPSLDLPKLGEEFTAEKNKTRTDSRYIIGSDDEEDTNDADDDYEQEAGGGGETSETRPKSRHESPIPALAPQQTHDQFSHLKRGNLNPHDKAKLLIEEDFEDHHELDDEQLP